MRSFRHPRLRRLLYLGGLVGLIACAPHDPAAADTPADSESGPPTPYEPDLTLDDQGAPLDTAALEEGLAEILAYLIRQDPLLQHEAWTQVFWDNAEDGVCPTVGDHNGQDYWREDCTTSAGARFNGWSLNFRDGGWIDEQGLNVLQYNWLSGHAFIEVPDGTRLENFGDVELLIAQGADHDLLEGFVFGDFAWDDPSASGTWLQEHISGELYFRFEDHGSYRTAWYQGGLTFLSGPVLAGYLDELSLDDAPGSCALEPDGRIRLRDPQGLWVEVAFGAWGAEDTACDGCGEANYEGAALGAVCADWTPLLSWSGWPWQP